MDAIKARQRARAQPASFLVCLTWRASGRRRNNARDDGAVMQISSLILHSPLGLCHPFQIQGNHSHSSAKDTFKRSFLRSQQYSSPNIHKNAIPGVNYNKITDFYSSLNLLLLSILGNLQCNQESSLQVISQPQISIFLSPWAVLGQQGEHQILCCFLSSVLFWPFFPQNLPFHMSVVRSFIPLLRVQKYCHTVYHYIMVIPAFFKYLLRLISLQFICFINIIMGGF